MDDSKEQSSVIAQFYSVVIVIAFRGATGPRTSGRRGRQPGRIPPADHKYAFSEGSLQALPRYIRRSQRFRPPMDRLRLFTTALGTQLSQILFCISQLSIHTKPPLSLITATNTNKQTVRTDIWRRTTSPSISAGENNPAEKLQPYFRNSQQLNIQFTYSAERQQRNWARGKSRAQSDKLK